MKHILILILSFASFAGYSQTVGQFRYDTTKFLKVGGRNHVMIENLIQTSDSTVKPLVVGADGVIKRNSYWPGGSGGGSGSIEYILQGYGIKIDSTGRLYTVSVDTAEINNIIAGDTTIFETTLDSTGQPNNRILFSRNRKISSSPRILIDSANSRVIINNANVSAGGANNKLFVGGQATVTGNMIVQSVPLSNDSTTYKPMVIGADGVLRKAGYWRTGSGGGGSIDTLFYNVKDFGAIGDSTTDDRAAVISAITAANNAGGGVVWFPGGRYRISDSILITHSVRLMGVSPSGGVGADFDWSGSSAVKNNVAPVGYTSVIYGAPNKSVFVLDTATNGTHPLIVVENLSFVGDTLGNDTYGSFITVRGNLQGPTIQNCSFKGGYKQVWLQSAMYQVIRSCHFWAPSGYCIYLDNDQRPDTGDGLIEGCTFNSGQFVTTAVAIYWNGGGGRRVSNCKFDASSTTKNKQFTYCIQGGNPREITSVWQIVNNSFENYQTSAIQFNMTNDFHSMLISSNQFAGYGATSNVIDLTGVLDVIIDNYEVNGASSTNVPVFKFTSCINPVVGLGSFSIYTSLYQFTTCTNPKAYNGNGLVVGPWASDATYTGISFNGSMGAASYNMISSVADPNLYINVPTGNNILFKEGGTTQMTLGTGGTLGLGTGAFPAATSSIMEIASTTKGFLVPRLTTTQRDAISTPADGLIIYNTTTRAINWYSAEFGITRWLSAADMVYTADATAGMTIRNTSGGTSAKSRLTLINSGSFGAYLTLWGSGTGFANKTFFESDKDFIIGTDASTANSGTSKFQVYTGGYDNASAPQFTINGDGSAVFKPMTATAASAITATDGMFIYVSSTNGTFTSVGFWGRENGTWIKL